MTGAMRRAAWSPYLVGAALGVLSWLAFLTADRGLGITTAFESTAALAVRAVVPDALTTHFADRKPQIDWETALVIGVFLGALGSAWLSGDRSREIVPRTWAARFGEAPGKRLLFAFVGGALLMFGARLAGGCTSGHGITGALQLAVSSWVFLIAFFAVAVVVARTLYRPRSVR